MSKTKRKYGFLSDGVTEGYGEYILGKLHKEWWYYETKKDLMEDMEKLINTYNEIKKNKWYDR